MVDEGEAEDRLVGHCNGLEVTVSRLLDILGLNGRIHWVYTALAFGYEGNEAHRTMVWDVFWDCTLGVRYWKRRKSAHGWCFCAFIATINIPQMVFYSLSLVQLTSLSALLDVGAFVTGKYNDLVETKRQSHETTICPPRALAAD